MEKQIRVLFVEDSESDANLVLRLLEKAGYRIISDRVETPDALRQSLNDELWDLIICDHFMPGLDAETALEILHVTGKDIPFIIVSGVIEEERAAVLMKKGAADYLFKNNLTRLVPSIKRELKEAQNRREKKRKDEELRLSEEMFSRVFRSSPIAITITRMSDGRFIELNDTAVEWLGYTRKELMGRTSVELGLYVNPEDRNLLIGELKAKGKVRNFETRFLNKNKKNIISWQSMEMLELNGERCVLSVYEDITARRKAENELKENETKFRTLTTVSPVGIFRSDLKGNIVYANERWTKITGHDVRERRGSGWMKSIHPDDRSEVMKEWKEVLTGGGASCKKEYRFQHDDGTVIWVICEVLPEKNNSGEITGYIGTLTDSTIQKTSEIELKRILGEQNLIAETSVDLVLLKTSGEIYSYLAKKIKEICPGLYAFVSGFDQEKKTAKITNIIGLERFVGPVTKILGKNPFDIEVQLSDLTETEIERSTNLKLNFEPGGIYTIAARKIPQLLCKTIEKLLGINAVYTIGFLWDNEMNGGVTFLVKNKESFIKVINQLEILVNQVSMYLQRKTLEEHVNTSEARYRRLFEAAKDGIIILDSESGKILDANPFICDILGYSLEELAGKKLWEIGVFDQKELSEDAFEVLKKQCYARYENIPLKTKTGKITEVEFISNIYMVGNEKVIQCNIRDVSERKRAEDKIKLLARFPSENPNPVIRTDRNGKILFYNLAAKEIIDFSKEKLPRLGWNKYIEECMEGKEIKIVEQEINDKTYSFSFTPIPEAEYLNIYGVDITDRKKAEEAIRLDEARMEGLLRISRYESESIQQFLDYSLEEVTHLTSSKTGYIYFYDEDTKNLRIASWTKDVIHHRLVENPQVSFPLDKAGFWGEAVRQKIPVIDNDFQASHPFKKGRPEGYAAILRFATCPVIFNGKIVAVVGVANKESDYNDSDIRQLILMMDSVWKYTERRKTEEELRIHRDHLEDLIRERSAELSRSEARFRTLFNKGNDAVLVHEINNDGSSGMFTDVNEIACDMFGYKREDILQMSPSDINVRMDTPVNTIFNEEIDKLSHNLFERAVFTSKKKPFFVEISAHEFELSGKKTVISIIRDISERKRTENELIKAREGADQANRSKSLFLSNMSHEIRTPLNAILGFSELLIREGALEGKQNDWLKTIRNSGEHLIALINDILDVSKIEAGKAELKSEDMDLLEFLEVMGSMFEIKSAEKGLRLNITAAKDVPRFIEIDAGKLRQILINLTGNAVKFTDKGSVTVRLYMAKNTNQPRLIADIEDTGAGIEPGEMGRLFGTFEQSAIGVKKGGTGLGLYISRKYARMMDGDITVTSTFGKGSCFHLEIAIKEAKLKKMNKENAAGQIIGLQNTERKFRILIVDDESANLNLLRAILKPSGQEIIEASNGKDAIESYRRSAPDMIFLDIRMPEMDGYDVISRIRADEKGIQTPIIALTASAFDEEKNKILENGADGYIRKPYRIEEILKAVHAHLGIPLIYKAADMPAEKNDRMSIGKELSVLPKELIKSLLKAAKSIDLDRVFELTEDVLKISPQLAGEIGKYAQAFQYEKIISMLEKQEEAK